MPTHKQGTVNSISTEGSLGTASTATVASIFSANPVGVDDALNDDGTVDAKIRANYIALTTGVISDAGHTFSDFNTDFVDAPAYTDVESGPAGLPGSAWTPNPASPGDGSVNPADQGAPPDGWGTDPSDTPGTGVGSQLSPADSSANQATATLGDYGLGKSPYSS